MSCFSCFRRSLGTPPNPVNPVPAIVPVAQTTASATQAQPQKAPNATPNAAPQPATASAPRQNIVPKGGSSKPRARRAFPFEPSYLDIWAARIYLNKQLGEDCFEIEALSDAFVLVAERDLTKEELEDLKKLSGKRD